MKYDLETKKLCFDKTETIEIDIADLLSKRDELVARIKANYVRLVDVMRKLDFVNSAGFSENKSFDRDSAEILDKARSMSGELSS